MVGSRSPKKARQTTAQAAGLTFPPHRFQKKLKSLNIKSRVGKKAGIAMAAALEYLVGELLDLAGNAAHEAKRKRIRPRELLLAFRKDIEFNELLGSTVICEGGVVPNPTSIRQPSPKTKVIAKASQTKTKAKPAVRPIAKNIKIIAKPTGIRKIASLNKSDDGGNGGQAPDIEKVATKKLFLGQNLHIVKQDITTLDVDAIIHPTNKGLYLGGRVGQALSSAVGSDLRSDTDEWNKNNPNGLDETRAISTAGHSLPCKKIIHVHSPQYRQNTDSLGNLTTTVKNALAVAENDDLSSIAFPAIGTGMNGFPLEPAAKAIVKGIEEFFYASMATSLKDVYFVLFDQPAVDAYKSAFSTVK